MIKSEKDEIFQFMQKFCSDNLGNRMNEWLAESFLNRAHRKLEEMMRAEDCPEEG